MKINGTATHLFYSPCSNLESDFAWKLLGVFPPFETSYGSQTITRDYELEYTLLIRHDSDQNLYFIARMT